MRIPSAALLLLAIACTDPAAPIAPERLTFTGTLNGKGNAYIALPATAGTIDDPPLIDCWTREPARDRLFPASCHLSAMPDGALIITITRADPLHTYLVVVYSTPKSGTK